MDWKDVWNWLLYDHLESFPQLSSTQAWNHHDLAWPSSLSSACPAPGENPCRPGHCWSLTQSLLLHLYAFICSDFSAHPKNLPFSKPHITSKDLFNSFQPETMSFFCEPWSHFWLALCQGIHSLLLWSCTWGLCLPFLLDDEFFQRQ